MQKRVFYAVLSRIVCIKFNVNILQYSRHSICYIGAFQSLLPSLHVEMYFSQKYVITNTLNVDSDMI